MHTSAACGLCAVLLSAAVTARAETNAMPAALPQAAVSPAVPPPSDAAALAIARDAADRMTVPVMIDGKGPFNFVVDTGADRTSISSDLATRLGLPAGRPVMLNGSSGARTEQTAMVDTLSVGSRQISNVEAPVLSRDWLGADGILGVDAVRDQAVVLDFVAHRMTVQKLRPDEVDPNAIVVNGRNRYGQLILLDAHVNGEPVYVILDSGTQTTVANSTFRREFADGGSAADGHDPVTVLSVIGGTTPGQFASVPELSLGELTLQHVPVVFSDLYTFSLFHLDQRPAMLLGINVLRSFDRVSIDYRHRKVSFTLNRSAQSWDMADRGFSQTLRR